MTSECKTPGSLMAKEAAEGPEVFAVSATQSVSGEIKMPKAIYTVARGSSDAAANILSYEFMRELGIPVTSLPPSVFSLGDGVALEGTAVMVVSQSGASHDLVLSAQGASKMGASVLSLTNKPDSAVEQAADISLSVCAGPELAVPATKSVVGSVAAGMALLGNLKPSYGEEARAAANALADMELNHPKSAELQAAFLRARHVYVIGRDTGYGTAHEIALKLKECCALHAEAYSSSEVLHGPLQLATNPLMVLVLDTGLEQTQESLDLAEARFRAAGCDVHRVRISDIGLDNVAPAAAAAALLMLLYPAILSTSLALGLDPDAPVTLSKVTQTT